MGDDDFDDGFTLVTHKHRGGKHKKSAFTQQIDFQGQQGHVESNLPKETIVKQVLRAQKDLQGSKFLSAGLKTLDKAVIETGNSSIQQIVCYGLGKFSECISARYQLSFLLCLRDKYQCSVLVYDPVFTVTEQQILPENFSLHLIEHNEEGRRVIAVDSCTLIFAPHCHKQLTNNFLWANWSYNLNNCIFLGNSFLKVILHPLFETKLAQYIFKISPYTNEASLENIFRFKDIFNDLAYHTFNTSEIPEEFWQNNKEVSPPVYPSKEAGLIKTSQHVRKFETITQSVERSQENELREKITRLVVS